MHAALDEALEALKDTGPEFGPGLSNHGPMAAEALVRLGRGDSVIPWVERYRRRLQERPRASGRIDPAAWREALGDVRRVGDWVAFFEETLRERPWRDVVAEWAPRLAPGVMAGATHGLIRTAHAVRSLEEAETPLRLRELAEGLGYWAARYQELPGRPGPASFPRSPAAAIELVERANPPGTQFRGLIFEAVRGLDERPAFAGVIDLAAPAGDVSRFLSNLTETFARVTLANPRTPIAFVHSVTAPAALWLLLPSLRPADAALAARYAWQACAALYAWYAEAGPEPTAVEPEGIQEDDLVARAVATGDEHAIKFVEACLRERRLHPSPAYVAAADQVIRALGR
ncbi:MAG TPA: questin oxidase family protein [Dehalococcoidia bacterium]|nr:questin oxidase family protein [Dehalococcoidia bacterium]